MANLLNNPGFDTDTSSWVNLGTTTMARTTADFHTGPACLDVATGTDFNGIAQSGFAGLSTGATFRTAMWLKAKDAPSVGVQVDMFLISNNTGEQWGKGFLLPADWTYCEMIATLTGISTNCRFDIRNSGAASNFFMDDALVEWYFEEAEQSYRQGLSPLVWR